MSQESELEVEVDPQLYAAVMKVVRQVSQQQEEQALQREAGKAVKEAKPRRPALRRLYDVSGAADQLSLSEAKVWALIKAARLRPVKVDSRTLITALELDRFAAEEVGPT